MVGIVAVLTLASACSLQGDEESSPAPAPAGSAETTTVEQLPTTLPSTTLPSTTLPSTTLPSTTLPPSPEDVESTQSPTNEPERGASTGSACPGVPAGLNRFELGVEGNTYSIRVLSPTARDDLDGPLPVVLNWHGLGSNGFQQAQLTGYELLAEQEGFLAVHPTGLPASGLAGSDIELPAPQQGRRSWELDQLDVPGRDDVAMASQLIDRLVTDFCADEARIYSTGMSNGGFFTSLLVCELSDRLAAAVSVAGLSHPDNCDPERPVPFMAFHGTDDQVVPYQGGDSSLLDASGVIGGGAPVPPEIDQFFEQVMPEEFAQFAASFRCRSEPDAEQVSGDVTAFRYAGCDDDVPLIFYRIDGGGHTWPGSPLGLLLTRQLGRTTFDVSATIDGWNFMRRFSRDE